MVKFERSSKGGESGQELTCHYEPVVGVQSNKVLLVRVSSEAADALTFVQAPHFQVTVRGRADKLVITGELDVGDSLAVTFEQRDRLLGISQVVVVNAVICCAEQNVELAIGLEDDAAHVRFGVE